MKLGVDPGGRSFDLRRRSATAELLGSGVSNSAEGTNVGLLFGAYAKFRRSAISFVMSIRCLSVCKEQLDSH